MGRDSAYFQLQLYRCCGTSALMKNNALLRASAALIALAPLTFAAAADARTMTPEDLATFNRLAAPTVSPDGQWVVYQQTDTNAESYARTTGLWIVPRDASAAPVRIADIDGANETSAAFSPDGRRLYFIADKSGKDQLWTATFSAATGTAAAPVQASDTIADVAGFRIAPNGQRIVMWGDIGMDCPTFGCADQVDRALPGPGTGRVYNQMFVRHWDSWEQTGIHSRAFTFAVGADGRLSGDAAAIGAELNG